MNGMIAAELRRTGGRGSPRLQKLHKVSAFLVSFYLSLMCLFFGITLGTRGSSTDCITFLRWSLISIGLLLMFTFIITIKLYYGHEVVTTCCYMLAMFLLLLALLSLMIVAFIHINIKAVRDGPEVSELVLDKPQPVHEYNLSDYGGLLRRRVADDRQYWRRISSCLLQRDACNGMSPLMRDPDTGELLAERRSKKYPGDPGLSPIESGCCKPPLSCGFTYVNQTTWTVPGVAPTNNTNDDDCSRWSNDQEKLCFQCNSCRAGVLADVQRAWAWPVILVTVFTIKGFILIPLALAGACNQE